jgi:hypothetical protein
MDGGELSNQSPTFCRTRLTQTILDLNFAAASLIGGETARPTEPASP